ncbi:uncharacterized protein RJT20DRAFT_135508 [Scheffersomyces xylosifermentans]|uniref:uncharacterized protein n=1 Tax=Scheffersomyces xylosifermentans TaxID=1304137 RepID=UPI00315D367D
MALCSQAFNSSTKRSCHFSGSGNSYQSKQHPNKKLCLATGFHSPVLSAKKSVCVYSSSEEDDDSADEQSCYNADQIRAKRRASTRVSFSLNSELTKAISQYSDDDEEDVASDISGKSSNANLSRKGSNSDNMRNINNSSCAVSVTAAAVAAVARHGNTDEDEDTVLDNLDCKLSSSPITSHLSLNIAQGSNNISKNFLQISDSSKNSAVVRNNSIPDTDRAARSRCFEYLVGAIDEAWARYCDVTAYVEDEVYGYNTPASVATDDEDYFENTTDITDYEDADFEEHHHKKQTQSQSQIRPRPSMTASSSTSSTNSSKQNTASCQLQALKDRLTKAKYYLQDLVDSDDYSEVNCFWKRWDMIKYATIELVEDDDDDEIVETTIDELEGGRLFVN